MTQWKIAGGTKKSSARRAVPAPRLRLYVRALGPLILAPIFFLCALPASQAAPSSKAPVPASEIPLKGPYRYKRGWYHKVQMGDTLPVLANRFGVDIYYLARVNGLKSNSNLALNSYLYIPPHSGHFHQVKPGETLNSIAKRYYLEPEVLAGANALTREAKIKAGEMLAIPTRLLPPPPPSASAAAKSNAATSRRASQDASKSSSSSPLASAPASPLGRSMGGGDFKSSGEGSAIASAYAADGGDVRSLAPRTASDSASDSPAKSSTSSASEPSRRGISERAARANSSANSRPSRAESARQEDTPAPAPAAAPAPRPSRSAAQSPNPRRPAGCPAFMWPLEGKVMRGYVN